MVATWWHSRDLRVRVRTRWHRSAIEWPHPVLSAHRPIAAVLHGEASLLAGTRHRMFWLLSRLPFRSVIRLVVSLGHDRRHQHLSTNTSMADRMAPSIVTVASHGRGANAGAHTVRWHCDEDASRHSSEWWRHCLWWSLLIKQCDTVKTAAIDGPTYNMSRRKSNVSLLSQCRHWFVIELSFIDYFVCHSPPSSIISSTVYNMIHSRQKLCYPTSFFLLYTQDNSLELLINQRNVK